MHSPVRSCFLLCLIFTLLFHATDSVSGNEYATLDERDVQQLAFSPTGKSLATSGRHGITVFDVPSKKQVASFTPHVVRGEFGFTSYSQTSSMTFVNDDVLY